MDEHKRAADLMRGIAELDRELVGLLQRRAELVGDLSPLRSGVARYAPIVDAAYLHELEQSGAPSVSPEAIRSVFLAIDTACRRYESAPRVAFTGAEGGFGWLAARSYFGPDADFVRVDSSLGAIDELSRSRADFAFVPYESPSEGPIFPNIQAIAAADVRLVGERHRTQRLALVSRTGDAERVERLYVTPSDRAAAARYIESNHPRAVILEVRSPVAACDLAADNDASAAIVPSESVLGGVLRVARADIGDAGAVSARYGVVARLPAPRSGNDATALLFSVVDRPGALHDLLQHFKERSCNLRRIQSRPIPGEGWEYVFYVEVSGHVTDRPLVAALEGVKRETKMLKIVGSFSLDSAEPGEHLLR